MEIRARAWDKINKRMIYHFLLTSKGEFVALRDPMTPQGDDYGTIDFILPNMDDVVLMLFTTLRDKHGKEIWEGDRITDRQGRLFIVQFKDGCFVASNEFTDDCLSTRVDAFTEVIGHIYEEGE